MSKSKAEEPTHELATTRRAKREDARVATLGQQALFLQNFSVIGVITIAAKAAHIDRKRHYEWLEEVEKYPDYRARFDDAYEQACDRLEAEMIRRGVQGWDEPVFYEGKQVGSKKLYSDRLLEIALKARRPDRFRERQEISGAGGGPIELLARASSEVESKIAHLSTRLEQLTKRIAENKVGDLPDLPALPVEASK